MKTLTNIETKEIVQKTGLKHIAIIMDGNRRWAKIKHLPSFIGHKNGVEVLKKTLRFCDLCGIKYLTVYAFSTENWKRTKEEVDFLMNLLTQTLENELDEMSENNVKLKFIGKIDELSEDLKKIIKSAENKTENNGGVNLQIAFNYGARDEITNAVKNIIEKKIPVEKIDEETIGKNLYTADIPDPDLLIRTGGEKRISNYLLWQIAYAEIIVIPEFWPEFNEEILSDCIFEFSERKRRFGK